MKTEHESMFHSGVDSFGDFSNVFKPVKLLNPLEASEGYAFANAKSEPSDYFEMFSNAAKHSDSFNPPETSGGYAPANVKDGQTS